MSHESSTIDMYFEDILKTFGTLYIPITKKGVGLLGKSTKNKILIVALVENQLATGAVDNQPAPGAVDNQSATRAVDNQSAPETVDNQPPSWLIGGTGAEGLGGTGEEGLGIYRLSFRVVDGDEFISNLGKNLSSERVEVEKRTAALDATATNYTELVVLPNTQLNVTNEGGKISLRFSRIFTVGKTEGNGVKKITYYGRNEKNMVSIEPETQPQGPSTKTKLKRANKKAAATEDEKDANRLYMNMMEKFASANKHLDYELVLTISPTFETTEYLSLSTHFSKIQLLQIGLFVKHLFNGFIKTGNNTSIEELRPFLPMDEVIKLYTDMFNKNPSDADSSTGSTTLSHALNRIKNEKTVGDELDIINDPNFLTTEDAQGLCEELGISYDSETTLDDLKALLKRHYTMSLSLNNIKQSIKRLAHKKVYFNCTSIFVDLYFFWLEYAIINQRERGNSTMGRLTQFVVALALVVSASTGLGLLAELGMGTMSVANGSFFFNVGVDLAAAGAGAATVWGLGKAGFTSDLGGGGSLKYIKGKKSKGKINKTRRKKQYSKRYKNTKKKTKNKRTKNKRTKNKRTKNKRTKNKRTKIKGLKIKGLKIKGLKIKGLQRK